MKRAEATARSTGDAQLIADVVDAMPDRGRFELLLDVVALAEQSGDTAQALDALERARALVDIEPAQRTVLFERSADVLGPRGAT